MKKQTTNLKAVLQLLLLLFAVGFYIAVQAQTVVNMNVAEINLDPRMVNDGSGSVP